MRFKVTLAYDGTNYAGFQIQPHHRTIQGEIEKALTKMAKESPIKIHASGRTDAGVHALGQVFHFDWPLGSISTQGVQRALNVLLPEDMTVTHVEVVSADFHARYHAKSKTYIYRVLNQQLADPFRRDFTYHHPYALDQDQIERALRLIIGEHDFSSFCAARTDKVNKVRTIHRASVEVDGDQNIWFFTFTGNGFLYHMIRILMGTLIEVGDGRLTVEEFAEILRAKDRTKAAKTLAPQGLFLKEVRY